MCHFIPSRIHCSLCNSHVHIHYSYVKGGCFAASEWAVLWLPDSIREVILFANKHNACNSSVIDYSSLVDLRPPLAFLSTSPEWNPTVSSKLFLEAPPEILTFCPFPCPVILGSKHSSEHCSVQVSPKQSRGENVHVSTQRRPTVASERRQCFFMISLWNVLPYWTNIWFVCSNHTPLIY